MPPVNLRLSEDAGLLQCEKPKHFDRKMLSLFGIFENQSLHFHSRSLPDVMMSEEEIGVIVEVYKPASFDMKYNGCRCVHPHFDWERRERQHFQTPMSGENFDDRPFQARIKIFDFSELQMERRSKFSASDSNAEFPQFDNPGSICHLLRSILKCGDSKIGYTKYGSNCASPWRACCQVCEEANDDGEKSSISYDDNECDHIDQVVCILLSNQINISMDAYNKSEIINDEHYWNQLEERELREFDSFRTSDACPNFYLYSVSDLKRSFINNYSPNVPTHSSKNGYSLFVYRHLPYRPQFQSTTFESNVTTNEQVQLLDGCLWEKVKSSSLEEGAVDKFIQRMVAPPYQDVTDLYGDLLKEFTCHDNLKKLLEEAAKIPQWTAWPEKNHYQSDYDQSDSIDSAYPASWTVFPLCHTFPASDVSKRQFIPMTCAFVPTTTKLLKSLGPYLRTALFSRLEPRTTLGAHTGWSDLANHVLRVHIPIKIPSGDGNDGLCGTWVDGCVETHKSGRIICFDDSKVHRAFNYSDEERIVLIVDLARPDDGFPLGTATGGHTDELDMFIKKFTN
jgi:hypothetical protein